MHFLHVALHHIRPLELLAAAEAGVAGCFTALVALVSGQVDLVLVGPPALAAVLVCDVRQRPLPLLA